MGHSSHTIPPTPQSTTFWQVLGLLFVELIAEQKDTIGSRYRIFYITRYISLTSLTLNIGGAIISTYSTAVFTVPLLLTPCSSQCSVHFCTGEKGQLDSDLCELATLYGYSLCET